ncbi:MAG: stage II sporulation protein M [Tissierellia bacterium]|nr:stage II sporulation protein M [Tissierellia bacterium]
MNTKIFDIEVNKEYKKYFKKSFIVAILAFLIAAILTKIIIYLDLFGLKSIIETQVESIINEILGHFPEGQITASGLFINNIRVLFLAFISGFIPFIPFPIVITIINGIVVGGLLGIIASNSSLFGALKMLIFGILPHGITELGAILIAVAMGNLIWITINRKIFRKPIAIKLNEELKYSIKILFFVCVPLILISAFIEAYITPILIAFMQIR